MPAYRVKFTFKSGSTQDDIALKKGNIIDAQYYAQYRADQLDDKPIKVEVKRISDAEAIDIVEGNGIDWYS